MTTPNAASPATFAPFLLDVMGKDGRPSPPAEDELPGGAARSPDEAHAEFAIAADSVLHAKHFNNPPGVRVAAPPRIAAAPATALKWGRRF